MSNLDNSAAFLGARVRVERGGETQIDEIQIFCYFSNISWVILKNDKKNERI